MVINCCWFALSFASGKYFAIVEGDDGSGSATLGWPRPHTQQTRVDAGAFRGSTANTNVQKSHATSLHLFAPAQTTLHSPPDIADPSWHQHTPQ